MNRPIRLAILIASGSLVASTPWAASPGACFGEFHAVSPAGFATSWIAPGDLDGDGDLDVVASGLLTETLVWFENVNGAGKFSDARPVNESLFGPSATTPCDLDGDGDLDIVAVFNGSIAWFENLDGIGGFGADRPVVDEIEGAVSPVAADLDLDGDPDLLVASVHTDRVVWFENLDGSGAFGPMRAITTEVSSPASVSASDLDGDGDLDVLSASTVDGKVAWYENLGSASFGPQRLVDLTTFPVKVLAADLDADGDNDLFAAASEAGWYENLDGRGNFGDRRILDDERVDAALAVDVDGDGRPDVVTASWIAGRIVWFEQGERRDAFLPGRMVADPAVAATLAAGDMDGDGDADIIAALVGGDTGDRVVWFENRTDGRGCDRDVVCHCAPGILGRCRTLVIDESELRGHVEHGDSAGACER